MENENQIDSKHNNPPPDDYAETLTGIVNKIDPLLDSKYAELFDQVETVAASANGMPPEVKSDDDIEKIATVVKNAKSVANRLDDFRKTEKQNFLDGGRLVDAKFKEPLERLNRISKVFEGKISTYQRAKIADERREASEKERIALENERKAREQAETAKRAGTVEKKLDQADDFAAEAAEARMDATRTNADIARVKTASGTTVSAKTFFDHEIVDRALFKEKGFAEIYDFIDPKAIDAAIKSKIKIQKGDTAIPGVRIFEDVKTSIR